MRNDTPVLVPTYIGAGQRPENKISEQVWSAAQEAEQFQLVGFQGPATQKTQVRVCYDRAALYVRFECFEDRVGSVLTKWARDDEPVWQDDSVELWLSPYSVAGKSKCHQFVVNAAGAKTYLRPGWTPRAAAWRAATVRLPDRWIAEITIPYETLRPLGRNEDCWRVNFCRNEHPHAETSSWSGVRQWFATYSRFGKLVPPDAPFRFNTFRGKLIALKPDPSAPVGTEVVTGPVKSLGSETRVVIPQPQEMHSRAGKGTFRIGPDTRIVIDSDAAEADLWAVDELNDAIEELGGSRLDTVHAYALSKDPAEARNLILIGETARNELLRAVCQAGQIRMPRSRFATGAHVVDVLPERVVACGQSPVDTYYAVQTLKQLIEVGDPVFRDLGASRGPSATDSRNPETPVLTIPAVGIRDFARFAFRGVHLLAAKDALSYIGKLIERVLAPLKVNHIVLQTDKVAWKSHPEVIDPGNFMTAEDVGKLIAIARRHHIAVTPLVQSPGHLEWAFRDKENLKFAEDPEHPYCYCMSNPKSYEFIFSIMDEAIEMFGHPGYFHAGRDEFDMRGKLPVDDACKAVGRERLYIQDTLKVYEHLKSRGCKMMMWGDELTKPGFRDLVDRLPKDILINDWRYSPSETYPSIDFYVSRGFAVIGCTWYDPRNIGLLSHYTAGRGVTGMMQTTWTGFQPEEVVLKEWPEQAYAYVLSAAWAWNPHAPDVNALPYKPDAVFKRAWSERRADARGQFSVVRLDRCCNIARVDSGRSIGWLGIGRGNAFREMPTGLVAIDGVPYKMLRDSVDAPAVVMLGGEGMADAFPPRVDGIRIDANLRSLHFLHACAYGAENDANVGSYVIHYEDGMTEKIDLVCGRNIHPWDDQSSGAGYGYAWKTRVRDGRTVGVGSLEWDNPRPEVKVASIDFVSVPGDACPFLLALTAEM